MFLQIKYQPSWVAFRIKSALWDYSKLSIWVSFGNPLLCLWGLSGKLLKSRPAASFFKTKMTKPRPPSVHGAPCGWTLEADVRLTVSPPHPTSMPPPSFLSPLQLLFQPRLPQLLDTIKKLLDHHCLTTTLHPTLFLRSVSLVEYLKRQILFFCHCVIHISFCIRMVFYTNLDRLSASNQQFNFIL